MRLFKKKKTAPAPKQKDMRTPEEKFRDRWIRKVGTYYPQALSFEKYLLKGEVKKRALFDQLWGYLLESQVNELNQAVSSMRRLEYPKKEFDDWLESSKATNFYHLGEFLEDQFRQTKNDRDVINAVGYYRRSIEKDPALPAPHKRLLSLYKKHAKRLEIFEEFLEYLQNVVQNPDRYEKYNNGSVIVEPCKEALANL